ncbi:MAG: hypothetical protein ACYDAC_03560 [Candidatus Dormibacteria bacterium]
MPGPSDLPDDLSPRQRARLRHRDRKRTTAMVVDNAAVKRTVLALANRRSPRPPEARKAPPPPE